MIVMILVTTLATNLATCHVVMFATVVVVDVELLTLRLWLWLPSEPRMHLVLARCADSSKSQVLVAEFLDAAVAVQCAKLCALD